MHHQATPDKISTQMGHERKSTIGIRYIFLPPNGFIYYFLLARAHHASPSLSTVSFIHVIVPDGAVLHISPRCGGWVRFKASGVRITQAGLTAALSSVHRSSHGDPNTAGSMSYTLAETERWREGACDCKLDTTPRVKLQAFIAHHPRPGWESTLGGMHQRVPIQTAGSSRDNARTHTEQGGSACRTCSTPKDTGWRCQVVVVPSAVGPARSNRLVEASLWVMGGCVWNAGVVSKKKDGSKNAAKMSSTADWSTSHERGGM